MNRRCHGCARRPRVTDPSDRDCWRRARAAKQAPPSPTSSGSQTSTTSSGTAGSLTVGSADFTESALLADIYADALQAKGVSITKKLNIGERSVYWKAMQDGSIDFFPEYNGSILYFLDSDRDGQEHAGSDRGPPGGAWAAA